MALIGDRPQPADVLAVQFRMHRGLAGRHPVDVAAQRVDLAVMGDHPVRMRQRPGREGVGRKALMHQRQRALEIGLGQVGIILAELVGEEHALVDDGAARHRHRIIAGEAAVAALVDRLRNRLAQDVELALELVLGLCRAVAADEHLHVRGLGRLDGFAERGIVGRHVAPAEQHQSLGLDLVGDDALDDFAPRRFLRHEQRADRVVAGLRQLEADLGRLAREEGVRNLHQNAGAVAGARIGADRAAMLEVAENAERVGDDLMRLLALDIGDEADAAGILFQRGIVKTLGGRAPAVLARGFNRFRGRGRRQRIRHDVFALELRPAHLKSSQSGKGLTVVVGAPWAFAAPTGPPLVLREPQFHKFRPGRSSVPEERPCLHLPVARSAEFRCNPRAGIGTVIETALLS